MLMMMTTTTMLMMMMIVYHAERHAIELAHIGGMLTNIIDTPLFCFV